MKNNRLLIVDDEQSIINCVTRQLRNEEYEIYSASSGEAGLRLIENKNIGVVISDFNMPGMTGIDFLNRVKKIRSKYSKDIVYCLCLHGKCHKCH
jgi:DNA-binding NtrC family response regulator